MSYLLYCHTIFLHTFDITLDVQKSKNKLYIFSVDAILVCGPYVSVNMVRKALRRGMLIYFLQWQKSQEWKKIKQEMTVTIFTPNIYCFSRHIWYCIFDIYASMLGPGNSVLSAYPLPPVVTAMVSYSRPEYACSFEDGGHKFWVVPIQILNQQLND